MAKHYTLVCVAGDIAESLNKVLEQGYEVKCYMGSQEVFDNNGVAQVGHVFLAYGDKPAILTPTPDETAAITNKPKIELVK